MRLRPAACAVPRSAHSRRSSGASRSRSTRAVEATIRREITELQAVLRADIATLVELTYELERLAGRIDSTVRALTPVSADDDA